MVELNEKALEAAKIARAAAMDMLAEGIQWRLDPRYIIALCDVVEGSTLPAPDGLVERLEYRVENPSAWDSFDQGGSDLCREAATAIRSKAEQIERLTRERDEALADPYKVMGGIYEKWKARAEAAEQQVQKLTAENERLREIVSECAAALPNGAHINPKASLDFMAKLPAEIRSVCSAIETQEGGK